MKNSEITEILRNISVLLEMDNVQFKPRAYEKAAIAVEALEEELGEMYRKGGVKALMQIPSVGQSIAEKIEELITTGKLKYYEDLRKKVPVDLESFAGVEGLGPKKIKILYKELKIRNVDVLEKAALAHRISKLPKFKDRTEQNILKGIEFVKKSKGRRILGLELSLNREIEKRLQAREGVKKAEAAGSVRRRKETIGDVDFPVLSENPKSVLEYFVSMPEVVRVLDKGSTNPLSS